MPIFVDVIDNLDDPRLTRANWEAVYGADPQAQIYLSWTWIAGWFERLDTQWLILAARAGPEASGYVGFFPLQLQTERSRDGQFYNLLKTGGGYFAGYTGMICDPGFELEAARAFAKQIRLLNWARVHLQNIFMSPRRLQRFLGGFPASAFTISKFERPDDGDHVDHDLYIYVELPDDWEDFLEQRLGSSTRRRARRTIQLVDAGGEFRITRATAETLDRDLAVLLRFWEAQWADKLAARYSPEVPRSMMGNYRNMFIRCFRDDALMLLVMWQGETPIGARATLIDRKARSLVCVIGGRDIAVKRPAPGIALHLYSIRWGIAHGFTTYDLNTGDYAYKYEFGALERRVECLIVETKDGRNLRGRLEPRTLGVVLARAQALNDGGHADEAEQACRQIIDVDPEHAGANGLLAKIDAARRPPKAAFGLGGLLQQPAPRSLDELIRLATRKNTP